MPYPRVGGDTAISNGVTSVDCQKQVRSWRLLRALLELLIPSCNCVFVEDQETKRDKFDLLQNYDYPRCSSFTSPTTITGTIFGYRHGKVSFCIQQDSKSFNPELLLELAVPTAVLAREMQGGILRIALECNSPGENHNANSDHQYSSLLSMPVWTMYCNGRKVGFAVKRRPSKSDMDALRIMSTVVIGAGAISGKELDQDDELMYLRANFQRVRGSSDSESFHLIDPDGNIGQELSIFLVRSR